MNDPSVEGFMEPSELVENETMESNDNWSFKPEKSRLVRHAMDELDYIGMTENSPDDMNRMMRRHLIHMVTEFAKEGHSGFSAGYAITALNKLFDFKPLGPLTGKDEEWNEVSEGVCQNKRCSTIFKDDTGRACNIDGRVFWEWYTDEKTGETYKSYFTNYYSRLPVEFPYDVPNKPIYEEWTDTWEDIRDNKVDWWELKNDR
jgi:hypothetical protein